MGDSDEPGDHLLGHVIDRLAGDDEWSGRRFLLLGPRDVAVENAAGGLVALDAAGVTTFFVVLRRLSIGAGSDIADELDRMALLPPADLVAYSEGEAALTDTHAAFFDLDDASRPPLSHTQEGIIVVDEAPDLDVWRELIVELGGQLRAVYARQDGNLVRLDVPQALQGGTRRLLSPAAVVAFLGIVALATASVIAMRGRSAGDPSGRTVIVPAAVRDVALGLPVGITHNMWIGQDRLVRTSDGRLIAAFGHEQALQLLVDRANHGRVWRSPVLISEIQATSLSVALDAVDRLHVVFTDGSGVLYTVVRETRRGWRSGPIVPLDSTAPTPYVDIAFDDIGRTAHVVWADETSAGQLPRWAAISGARSTPVVLRDEILAPPARDIPVLVNIATGGSQTLVTYRRGDSTTGWFSRVLQRDGAKLTWQPQERIPTDEIIGAGAVVVDRRGDAHLVLRDSSTFEFIYFRRDSGGGWSQGETVVDADSIDEIDLPSLTVDGSSHMIYVFYQSSDANGHSSVHVAVRDPVSGWGRPFDATPGDAAVDPAAFPTSLGKTSGAPVVLWGRGGTTPALQAAVLAP